MESPNLIILLIADSNFKNLCSDPEEYVARLKKMLGERGELYTVSGRFGLSEIDPSLRTIEVEDRNKTIFTQTLENSCGIFDQFVVVSLFEEDPFIVGAREVATNYNKTLTQYGYVRKG